MRRGKRPSDGACALLFIAALAACAPALFAAELRCRLINGTTGGSAAVDSATLMKLGQGMEEVASLSAPKAPFTFKGLSPQEQYLLQVTYKSVHYNTQFTFGDKDVLDKEITVYEVAGDDSRISLSIPHLVVGLEGDTITADLEIDVMNGGNTVYAPADGGGFRFALPAGFSRVETATATTSQMPMPQDVAPLDQPGLYIMKYPMKPGQTQVNLVFRAPYKGRFDYKQEFLYPLDDYRIFVLPPSTSVQSDSLEAKGEGESGFAEYVGGKLPRGGRIDFSLTGAAAEARGATPAEDESNPGGGQIINQPPALFRYRSHLILLMVLILSLAYWFGLREPHDSGLKGKKT